MGYETVIDLGRDSYKAETWRHSQRLILVVVDKPDPKTGQLDFFPHHFFLVTSWRDSVRSAEEVLEHYRGRGTFEDRIGEFQRTISPLLSSPHFEENEASFLLSQLSFNLLSIIRGEIEAGSDNGWGLSRLQKTVLKTGARITKGARRLIVDIALAVVPLWDLLFKRFALWRLPARWPAPRGPQKRPWVAPPEHAHLHLVVRE